MKTEFSLFNGFDSYEFIEPFEYGKTQNYN
jgi:hypothetical protein